MPSVLGTNALADVAGAITDFFEKLAGPEGTTWLNAFKRFLRKENPWTSFPIWKTIHLGTGLQNACEFRGALINGGFRISDWGNDVLGKPAFKVANTLTEVDLVNVSVAELGFKNGATRQQIYERAISLGLQLCPSEVGPQLRLQCNDQPGGYLLRIAMEPIADSVGSLLIFVVARDGVDLWLRCDVGNRFDFWFGSRRFLFVRPRE